MRLGEGRAKCWSLGHYTQVKPPTFPLLLLRVISLSPDLLVISSVYNAHTCCGDILVQGFELLLLLLWQMLHCKKGLHVFLALNA